jgi:hypothetical protein
MKGKFYISRADGVRRFFSDRTVQILGSSILSEFIPEESIQKNIVPIQFTEVDVKKKEADVVSIQEIEEPVKIPAVEVIENIPNMDKESLLKLIDTDMRVTVQRAARKELNERDDDNN